MYRLQESVGLVSEHEINQLHKSEVQTMLQPDIADSTEFSVFACQRSFSVAGKHSRCRQNILWLGV